MINDKILWERKVNPYWVRVLSILVEPMFVILIAAIAGLIYFAVLEGATIGEMLVVPVFLSIFLGIGIYNFLKSAATKVIRLELVEQALKIVKVNRDRVEEMLIPARELQLEVKEYKNRKNNSSYYSLQIFHGYEERPIVDLRENRTLLAGILHEIEHHQLVTLKATERDFITQYFKKEEPESRVRGNSRILKFAFYFIAVIAMGSTMYNIKWGENVLDGFTLTMKDEDSSDDDDWPFVVPLDEFPNRFEMVYITVNSFNRSLVCDKNSFIEVIKDGELYRWRMISPDGVTYEAILSEIFQNRNKDYLLKFTQADGTSEEKVFAEISRRNKVYQWDYSYYTLNPDLFPVVKNDRSNCN